MRKWVGAGAVVGIDRWDREGIRGDRMRRKRMTGRSAEVGSCESWAGEGR